MKKRIFTMLLICLLLVQPLTVHAAESTSYTYTTSVDGQWIRTQDAYLPGEVLLRNEELLQPEDIFYRDGMLYIADTGNRRIGKYELKTENLVWLEIEGLKKPTGLFVDAQENLYIADYGAECVWCVDKNGETFLSITRPDSYLFSESSRYKPKNVAVSSGGTIYVVGEGSYEGIMQFNSEGVFEGYFAANTTPMSMLEKIQEMIFTEEQLQRLFNRSPRAVYNADMTNRDLLFSVTQDSDASLSWNTLEANADNNVKLHNFAGNDIFSKEEMIDEWNFVDVAAAGHGGCYALTYSGVINEYDLNGNLLFSFGGRAVGSDRSGLFTYATAITCDDAGYIYVLDREKAMIQTFYPTQFALTTHSAITKMEQGDYKVAGEIWRELLTLNGMSRIAHNGYGKALYFQGDYQGAMKHFRLAGNKADYSEAFWEIRDQWIHNNGGVLIFTMLALYILWKLVGRLTDRISLKPGKGLQCVRKTCGFMATFLRHPIDSAYEIKKNRGGSVLSATVLYLLLIAVYLWDYLYRGFIFNPVATGDVSVPVVLAVLVIPVGLWIIGSYLVGTIRDGEGSFRGVYISTAYSLLPYVIGGPLVLVLTYVLSSNEAFIFTFFHLMLLIWCGVNLFLVTREVHNYEIKETIINMLITLFFIVMAVIACVILYLIWLSVWEYLSQVFGEVRFRVLE